MPSVEEGFKAHLLADPSVTALIGTRVYYEHMPPRPTYPAVVYERINTERQATLDGPTGLTYVNLHADCISMSTMAESKAVAAAVKNSIDGVTGSMGGATVQFVRYTDETSASLFDGDNEYRVTGIEISVITRE